MTEIQRKVRRTQKFESKSSPGTFYTCTLYEDGTSECDMTPGNECKGYKYSKATPRECKHTKEMIREFNGGKISKTALNINMCPVQPMLASGMPEGKTVEDFSSDGWFAEEKYNGHRRIIDIAKMTAWSRVGNEVGIPEQIKEGLRGWKPALIDGEFFVPGGVSTDTKALENEDKLVLAAFDILEECTSTGGRQTTLNYDQSYRRSLLQRHASTMPSDIVFVSQLHPVSTDAFREIRARGGEGLILKRKNGMYRPLKRSKDWIKVKEYFSHAMMITGFTAGEFGPCSVIDLMDEHGATTSVKNLNDAWRAAMEAEPQRFLHQILFIEHQGRTTTGSFISPMADHFLREDLV
jgi:hypothetical protein